MQVITTPEARNHRYLASSNVCRPCNRHPGIRKQKFRYTDPNSRYLATRRNVTRSQNMFCIVTCTKQEPNIRPCGGV